MANEQPLAVTEHGHLSQQDGPYTVWKGNSIAIARQLHLSAVDNSALVPQDEFPLEDTDISNIEALPNSQTVMFLLQMLLVKCIAAFHPIQQLFLFVLAHVVLADVDFIQILASFTEARVCVHL